MLVRFGSLSVLLLALFAIAPAAAGEDLYILEKGAAGIDSIASLDDVHIYAILNKVLLVGATQSGADAFVKNGMVADGIGARDPESEYFVFRIADRDIARLGTDVDIV